LTLLLLSNWSLGFYSIVELLMAMGMRKSSVADLAKGGWGICGKLLQLERTTEMERDLLMHD
jgi:hypothetical protein